MCLDKAVLVHRQAPPSHVAPPKSQHLPSFFSPSNGVALLNQTWHYVGLDEQRIANGRTVNKAHGTTTLMAKYIYAGHHSLALREGLRSGSGLQNASVHIPRGRHVVAYSNPHPPLSATRKPAVSTHSCREGVNMKISPHIAGFSKSVIVSHRTGSL